MGTSIEAYIPVSMADDLRKLKISTTSIIQKALREAIAAKKAHIAWAEAGCPEEVIEETPSLKELLNITPDEGTMSYLVTVEHAFNARTTGEGVQQALAGYSVRKQSSGRRCSPSVRSTVRAWARSRQRSTSSEAGTVSLVSLADQSVLLPWTA